MHKADVYRGPHGRLAVAKCVTTGVIQMMLPVLLSESFVYHYLQNPAVVGVYG